MDLGLKNKVAVIVGGTTGIGAAAAFRFLTEGCKVAVCSRSAKKVDDFLIKAQNLGFLPDSIMAESADAASYESVETFSDGVANRFGRIDCWVNCAGGNRHGPLYSLTEEDFKAILDQNLTSAFFGIKAACKYMIPQKSGAICNISSLASVTPVSYRVTYGAAKAGVNLLTYGAAGELAPFGIRVNAVAPGMTDTALSAKAIHENTEHTMSMIPLRRAGKPEEIANVIVCICSEKFSFMTGEIVRVSGGQGATEDASLVWTTPWEVLKHND